MNFVEFCWIYLNLLQFAVFEKRLMDGRTDGRIDGQTDRRTKPLIELLFATKNGFGDLDLHLWSVCSSVLFWLLLLWLLLSCFLLFEEHTQWACGRWQRRQWPVCFLWSNKPLQISTISLTTRINLFYHLKLFYTSQLYFNKCASYFYPNNDFYSYLQ